MRYNFNGKSVNIPTKEIENLMSNLGLSKEDAIDLWLCDHDLEEDEEQAELDEKASKVQISKDIVQKKPTKERKKPEKKVSDEKKELFNSILTNLTRCNGVEQENITVLNENKLISVKIGEKLFKIDVIETRQSRLDKK